MTSDKFRAPRRAKVHPSGGRRAKGRHYRPHLREVVKRLRVDDDFMKLMTAAPRRAQEWVGPAPLMHVYQPVDEPLMWRCEGCGRMKRNRTFRDIVGLPLEPCTLRGAGAAATAPPARRERRRTSTGNRRVAPQE